MNPLIKNAGLNTLQHVLPNVLKTAVGLKAAQIVTTRLPDFNAKFGIEVVPDGQKKTQKKSTGGPSGAHAKHQKGTRRTGAKSSSNIMGMLGLEEEEEKSPLHMAKNALDNFSQGGGGEDRRQQVEEALEKIREPLQRYIEVFKHIKKIEKDPNISEVKKLGLKDDLNEMLTDLHNRDRTGVRRGLREGAETSPVAAAVAAAQAARGVKPTIRDIRFGIGARAKGGIDEELPAATINRAVNKNFGPELAREAVDSFCSRLSNNLRKISATNFPAYVLAASDMAEFAKVKSSFKIAEDLKRDMVGDTNNKRITSVLSPLHYAEISEMLLNAAERGWGKGKGMQLVTQIVDLKGVNPRTRARVYTLVRDAVNKLPVTAWPRERVPARKELLEDLDRLVFEAHDEIAPLTTKAERREEEWRNTWAAGRAPTLPDRQ